jgi:ABC-2 type transport system permease protein
MIRFLLEKEFKQIRRNAFVPKLLVAMPLAMMLVFPWAADQEVRNVRLAVVDGDHSATSRRLVQKVVSSGFFHLTDVTATYPEAMESVEAGRADIILEIAPDFERDIVRGGSGRAMIAANAVNSMKGALGSSYLASILADYSEELLPAQTGAMEAMEMPAAVPRFRFNPTLDYKVFMVPALMVMLLTMLCGFLPALNIVAEKEAGTIEQMNVTPVKKRQFIVAKLLPYWIIGFAVLGLCIVLAGLVYGLWPAGSVLTIFLGAGIYILVVSGVGLVISNYSDTMQQAMFVMFFFVLILLLISGLFTPVRSMPGWAQAIAAVNPLKYFIEVMRMVYLKGSGLSQLLPQLAALAGFALVFNSWAVGSYAKSRK